MEITNRSIPSPRRYIPPSGTREREDGEACLLHTNFNRLFAHTATASRVRQPGELFSPPRCITIKCRFISASFTFRLGAAAHAHYLQHLTLQTEIFRYEWVDLDHMAGLGIDDRGQPRGEICLFADLEREINTSNWIFSRSKSLQIRG